LEELNMYVLSGMGATEQDQVQKCQLACYDAKSKAYDDCRAIPPAERKTRIACFQGADAQLRDCLGKCSGPSGATIAVVAGIGLLVLKAVS
jgi:hypothetical protein